MHEGRVPLGERDGHAGGQYGPLTGLELARFGGAQIGPGVPGVLVRRQRYVGVDAAEPDVERGAAHGFTSKARARRIWSGSLMAAWISWGRPWSVKWSTFTSMNSASARTATGPSGPPMRPVARE